MEWPIASGLLSLSVRLTYTIWLLTVDCYINWMWSQRTKQYILPTRHLWEHEILSCGSHLEWKDKKTTLSKLVHILLLSNQATHAAVHSCRWNRERESTFLSLVFSQVTRLLRLIMHSDFKSIDRQATWPIAHNHHYDIEWDCCMTYEANIICLIRRKCTTSHCSIGLYSRGVPARTVFCKHLRYTKSSGLNNIY
jgi:hypothetical protein